MALHRPYIRQGVREEVKRRAEKNEKGQFLDANTHEPIEGKYDLGHKAGHEHWREAKQAEKEGLTQEEFNDRMNNPDYFQIEDPHENRSHAHEMPAEEQGERKGEEQGEGQGEEQGEGQGEEQGEGQGEEQGEGQGEEQGEGQGEECGQEM